MVPAAVREHPRIRLIQGDSTDPNVVAALREASGAKRAMVILDSDHSAHHVLEELLPGPAEALAEWLEEGQPFEVDRSREKFLLTGSPGGYLRRVAAE